MIDTPTRKPQPLYERSAIVEALGLILAAGQVTELRALDATTAKDRWPCTLSGYFDDPEKLAEAVAAITSAKGIYIIPNPVDPALLARAENRIRKAPKGESTQDTHIVARLWLLIDADAQRPSGISATAAEHEAAVERVREIYRYLKGQGWPDPIAADSGNGAHLMYRIELPTDDGGLVQQCLHVLARRFDDDTVKVDQTVFNPARIWKLYGTLTCKGDNTAERPHRMARILNAPSTLGTVPLPKLEALVAEAEEHGEPGSRPLMTGNSQPFDVEAFIARHRLDVTGPEPWNGRQGTGRRWVFSESPMCDHNDGAAFILEHAGGAISAECHHNSCSWTWRDLRAKLEPPRQPSTGSEARMRVGSVPVLVKLADVKPEPVRWLWPGRIAIGKLTLLSGDPGLGKSLLTIDVAARASTGAPWPDARSERNQDGGVVLLNAEDDLADTIRPRLDAAGADVSRVVALMAVCGDDQDSTYKRPIDLSRDLDAVERAIEEVADCRLVVVDPISAYLGKTNSYKDAEVRGLLAPLAELAARRGVAVLAVNHLRKSGGPAVYRSMGSLAFAAAARAVWAVAKDKQDPSRRLLLPVKNNLGADTLGLAFAVVSEPEDGPPVIAWEPDPVNISADDALAEERAEEGSALGEAVDWLRDTLGDGPMEGKNVKGRARTDGIAQRTLDRAKAKLGVIAGPDGFGGPWVWRLPDPSTVRQDSAEYANPETVAHSGKAGALCEDEWGEVR